MPSASEYLDSVAYGNARMFLKDPDLVQCSPLPNENNPWSYPGSFGIVFHLGQNIVPHKERAIKCFFEGASDLQERYALISSHLSQVRLPFMLACQYVERAIVVNGKPHPLLKMDWADGVALNKYIEINLDRPKNLTRLAEQWLDMAIQLRKTKIAHGDLQHENIKVKLNAGSPQLVLVDYDGMWVPGLTNPPDECGKPQYQHRLRKPTPEFFHSEMDRFSLLLISTVLSALRVEGRKLWDEFYDRDCLLFKDADLQDPATSRLFRRLWHVPDSMVRNMAGHLLLAAVNRDIRAVPFLGDLLLEGQCRQLTAAQETHVETLLKGAQRVRSASPSARASAYAKAVQQPLGRTRPVAPQRRPTLPTPRNSPISTSSGGQRSQFVSILKIAVAAAASLVGGWIGGAILAIVAYIVVGLLTWSSATGETVSSLTGIGVAFAVPLACLSLAYCRSNPGTNGYGYRVEDYVLFIMGFSSGAVAWAMLVGWIVSLSMGWIGWWGTIVLLVLSLAFVGVCTAILFQGDGSGRGTPASVLLRPVLLGIGGLAVVLSLVLLPRFYDATRYDRHAMVVPETTTPRAGPDSASKPEPVRVAVTPYEAKFDLTGHTDWVTSVAVSGDGKRIVTASSDHTVKLWDGDSGTEIRSLGSGVHSVSISADGKRIVSGSEDNTVKVFCDRGNTMEIVLLKGHTDTVSAVAITPDGRRIVSGSNDKTVRVWDAQQGTEIIALRGHNSPVTMVAISADGKRIAGATRDRMDPSVRVWDVQTGTQISSFNERAVNGLAITPHGNLIVTASLQLKVWDAERAMQVRVLKGHKGPVLSAVLSFDGRRIVSGSHDTTVKVWDVDEGTEIASLGHTAWAYSVAISADGKRIVAGSGGYFGRSHERIPGVVRVWDADPAWNRSELAAANEAKPGVVFKELDTWTVGKPSREDFQKSPELMPGRPESRAGGTRNPEPVFKRTDANEDRKLFEEGSRAEGGAPDFRNGFLRSTSRLTYNGSAAESGTRVRLDDQRRVWQAGSVFTPNRIVITRFTSNFTFQLSAGRGAADGITFTIQGMAPTALGAPGGGLGYGRDPDRIARPFGIDRSVAVKFDLYNNQGEGTNSTGLFTNGAAPGRVGSINLTGTGLDLHSGHVFRVGTVYDGTTLTVTITDSETAASTTQNYVVDIPAIVGSADAYVGFTGGTGSRSATQEILAWTWSRESAGRLPGR